MAFISRTLKKYSIMENLNIYKSRKLNELSCLWPFFKITYTNAMSLTYPFYRISCFSRSMSSVFQITILYYYSDYFLTAFILQCSNSHFRGKRLHFKFHLPVKRCAHVFLSLLAWSYSFRELLLDVGSNLCLMVLTPCLESGLKKITIGNHWV